MSEAIVDQGDDIHQAVRRESPLHYMIDAAREHKPSNSGVVIQEEGLRGHLNLRGDPEDEIFRTCVAEELGLRLPVIPGTCVGNDQACVYWLGPNEWLVIVKAGVEAGLQRRLRQSLSGHFSIVDVSGGQTLLKLSGAAVENVLKKSCVYDFHPSRFAAGSCVQTTFAKATALVSKTADNSFELIIRRSFADYIFRWIVDAADEYGVEVITEDA